MRNENRIGVVNNCKTQNKEAKALRLYEYEGKILFDKKGITVPASVQAREEQDILQATATIGYPCVIKAQVLRGGRGKAGLIRVVEDDNQAVAAAEHIKAYLEYNEIMLVEPKITADSEAYIGITVDDLSGTPILVISTYGGVEVEELAAGGKSGLARMSMPVSCKAERYQILQVAKQAGFSGVMLNKITDMAWKLYDVFLSYECETAEINPVFVDNLNNRVIAGDAKVITDDYAFFRQPEWEAFRTTRDSRENDVKMIYLALGGNVGIISLGASQTMMVMDTIKKLGGESSNFADIVSGASKENLKELSVRVMQDSHDNKNSKAIIATFTLVAHPLRNAVEALVEAMAEIKPQVPVVASFRAAGAALISMSKQEAFEVLKANNIICHESLEAAIQTVVDYSKS